MGPPNFVMKFLRVGNLSEEKPSIIDKDGIIRDLSSIIEDLNPKTINQHTIETVKKSDLTKLPEIPGFSVIFGSKSTLIFEICRFCTH